MHSAVNLLSIASKIRVRASEDSCVPKGGSGSGVGWGALYDDVSTQKYHWMIEILMLLNIKGIENIIEELYA